MPFPLVILASDFGTPTQQTGTRRTGAFSSGAARDGILYR